MYPISFYIDFGFFLNPPLWLKGIPEAYITFCSPALAYSEPLKNLCSLNTLTSLVLFCSLLSFSFLLHQVIQRAFSLLSERETPPKSSLRLFCFTVHLPWLQKTRTVYCILNVVLSVARQKGINDSLSLLEMFCLMHAIFHSHTLTVTALCVCYSYSQTVKPSSGEKRKPMLRSIRRKCCG